MTGLRLRLALFLGLIIVPAGVLTFLSLRAVFDEQRGALADLRLQVPGLSAALGDRLRTIQAELSDSDAFRPAIAADHPDIVLAFSLGSDGDFSRPRVLRPVLLERSPAFAAALGRGEQLELGATDPAAAAIAYRAALAAAASDAETAEALNALGRAALAAGDTAQASDTHRRLSQYAGVLDADGAHPLTLSTQRQALSAGDGSGGRTVGLVESWVRAVLADEMPLHPGTRLAVDALRPVLRRRPRRIDWPALVADLDRIAHRADFTANYDRLLETAAVRPEATYLCGMGPEGRTLFAVMRPRADGEAAGLLMDLEVLADDILASPAAVSLRRSGFGLALFDTDGTADFERRHGEATRLVSPASSTVYRLNLGVFTRDEPFVFEHYRNRSALLVGGIALLAAAIGLGVWVLMRETAREVETARLRSDFVANVSHELRTPLTAIRLYAETLLIGRVRPGEQQRDYLQTVMRESQRLSRMVDNILDFSRLESGRKTYDFADVDIGRVVGSVLEEFDPVFREQGFEIGVDLAPDLPTVRADSEALETATANLLANAVKYSPLERSIHIQARVEGASVVLDIADRGIGIPPGEHGTVFGEFRRATNAPGTASGTGLGLALVAATARAHGGAVEALPRDGGGCVLRLTLPLTRSP